VSSENNLNVISSAAYGFHQISKSGSDDSFFGGATIVDTSFMESVTSSFLTFVQEPLQYRGTAIVSRDEFLAGQVTGIPSTRVLMTQHLMLGIKEASLHQADSKPAIDVFHVPIEGSRFHVSLKGFHPPDVRDCAHSGDQIRDWIEKTDIFKEGNLVTVLEAGCGPGYLTRQLLKRSKSIKIIAVDNDDKSLEAFKQNQKEVERDKILVIPSSTDDLEMGYDADIGLITVEHENLQVCPVNVILVELPLVATISDRSITARELPYIDNIDEFGLPLSIGNILRKIRESTDGFCSGLISTVIVVPIISGSISEYESGIQTTQEALGSTWKCSVENTVGSQIKWPRIDLIIATHEGNVSKINE
jgi:SAM-dependent methyltransferase